MYQDIYATCIQTSTVPQNTRNASQLDAQQAPLSVKGKKQRAMLTHKERAAVMQLARDMGLGNNTTVRTSSVACK